MYLRLVLAAIVLAGCTTGLIPKEVRAVRDYVALAELNRVDRIRLYKTLNYRYVNDYFVSVSIGNRHYLVEFDGNCRAIRSRGLNASVIDHRQSLNYIKVPDTIRGCPTDKIYELTEDQLLEIRSLSRSQATGELVPVDA